MVPKTIYKSKKKARLSILIGILLGLAGILVLLLTPNIVISWCLIIGGVLVMVYGVGNLLDRKPQIILTTEGITELFTIREPIEWEAILHVDDFFYRGQYFIRLLVPSDYKPDLIKPTWFWRLDRIYRREGFKAIYIRVSGLELGAGTIARLIEKARVNNLEYPPRRNYGSQRIRHLF